jgi:TonB family protein
MNGHFLNALAASVLVHVMALSLAPGVPVRPGRDIERRQPLLADYIRVEDRVSAAERPAEEARMETPRTELKKPAAEPAPPESAAPSPGISSRRDYVSYYQLIREKVRRRLKINYRGRDDEGEVRLVFTVSSDGRLLAHDADRERSVRDESLIDIALASLREASPFPEFPKGLTASEMSFNLTVAFKKR